MTRPIRPSANPKPPSPGISAVWTAAVMALLLSACAPEIKLPEPEAPPPPTKLHLRLSADKPLNPNTDGSSAPLMVRIYELKSSGPFTGADYFALLDRDGEALGDSLLGREELRFTGGSVQSIGKELNPETRFVGIMGAYRKIDRVRWRAVVEIYKNRTNTYGVRLGKRELSIEQH